MAVCAFVAAVAALGLAGCGAATNEAADRPSSPSVEDVYKMTVYVPQEPGDVQLVEWIAPRSGRWRMEYGGRTRIFTGRTYVVTDEYGSSVRTGSKLFLRGLAEMPVTAGALRRYLADGPAARGVRVTGSAGRRRLHFSARGEKIVAAMEKVADSAARRLFAVPTRNVHTRTTELPVGAPPTLPVAPYWFGRTIGERRAVMAVEHHSAVTPEQAASGGWSELDNADAYIVFYETPAAGGLTSAVRGQDAPKGELQVVSQAIASAAARDDLHAFSGRLADMTGPVWPRARVALSNGEEATVFMSPEETPETNRFAIATSTTLISVTGTVPREEIAAMAQELRPVGR